jgi:outer membrane cobalamin receptor
MQNERAFTLTYSEGFRAPSLSELYLLHEASYGVTMQGNPSLSPEKVRAAEAMYEHPHSDSWHWSISVFHNRYENMIDFVYNMPVEARNRKKVIGIGGEFELRWKPLNSFNITGSYAYLDMADHNGGPILYRSTHRGRLHFNYFSKIISVQLGVRGWSKQVYENFLFNTQCDQNKTYDCFIQKNGKIIFPIHELPERIIYELIFSREIGSYTGSFHISNLFDTKYELIQDFPMPGRTWQFTLTKNIIDI